MQKPGKPWQEAYNSTQYYKMYDWEREQPEPIVKVEFVHEKLLVLPRQMESWKLRLKDFNVELEEKYG